jgi:GxxExxY protein
MGSFGVMMTSHTKFWIRPIVEVKALDGLDRAHYGQCINYLKATGLRVCLLLNFGRPRLEVKRLAL